MNYTIDDIRGVIPALITCFDADEHFDEKRQRGIAAHLIDNGVSGLYLTGSTGDAFLMTSEERKRVVETVIDETAGRIPVIVHVGAISTKTTEQLAVHAYESGADAISTVPPFYWPFGEDNIYQYYKEVTEATPLPMIMYNVQNAGLIDFDCICRIASLKGIEGIKYTSSDHYELAKIRDTMGDDFAIYSGMDQMALSGLMSGSCGIIGTFYNLLPEVFVALHDAVVAGDIERAKERQYVANLIIAELMKYDYIPMIKELLSLEGIDVGRSKRPFSLYSKEQAMAVKAELKELAARKNIKDVCFLAS